MAEVKDKLITVETAKVIHDSLNEKIIDVVYSDEESVDTSVNTINADTLGGHPASDFAMAHDVENLTADDVGARPDTWLPTIAEIGAAPAGFGLGKHGQKITDDLNNINRNGFYYWETAHSHTPFNWGYMIHIESYGEGSVQIAFSVAYKNITVVRRRTNSEWGEWEYVNPPMALGVEYRTTERWNDKAVYTKLVACGNAANGTTSINHGIAMEHMLRCSGNLGNTYALPLFTKAGLGGAYSVWCNATTSVIEVFVGNEAALSAYTVYVQLWYTKY